MCIVVLVVSLVGLTSPPIDPLGYVAGILLVVVAVGGLLELAGEARRRQ